MKINKLNCDFENKIILQNTFVEHCLLLQNN
jgi:hypothetical protein